MEFILPKSLQHLRPLFNPDSQIPWSSPNEAHHYTPTKEEQAEAEEIARDILGEGLIEAPTVQIILKLQATRMNPLEWQEIRDVLEINEKALTDIRKLCSLLRQPEREEGGKGKGNEHAEGESEVEKSESDGSEGEGEEFETESGGQGRQDERRYGWDRRVSRKYHWES